MDKIHLQSKCCAFTLKANCLYFYFVLHFSQFNYSQERGLQVFVDMSTILIKTTGDWRNMLAIKEITRRF